MTAVTAVTAVAATRRARRARAAGLALAALAGCGITGGERDLCDEGLCAPGTLTWAGTAASLVGSTVDAVAPVAGEPPWFAGRYDESVSIPGRHLNFDGVGVSDVYAARLDVERLAPWLTVVLAAYPVRAAAILPDPEDGVIVLVIGQQEDTRHRVEAVWLDRRYDEVARAPVALLDDAGAGGGVAADRDGRGWPIVAVSGTRVDLDGALHDGPRAMVFRLGQGLRRELLADLPGVDLADLRVDGDALAIGGSYLDGPAGWPACAGPDRCGFVAVLELATGATRWIQPVRAPGGAAVHAVGVGGFQVAALASAAGAPTEPALGAAPVPAYVLGLLTSGDAGEPFLLDQTVLAADGTDVAGGDLEVTADGSIVVGLAFRGTALVGNQPLEVNAPDGAHASVVGEISPEGNWQWALPLGRADLVTGTVRLSTLAVLGTRVVVGGVVQGGLAVSDPRAVGLPPASAVPNGFALELVRAR